MKLFARVIEGEQEGVVFQASCTQDGFNELWNKGKELWDSGTLSKYEIGVFTDSYRRFWSLRPDKINFEENILVDCFMECAEEELNSFLSPDFQKDNLEMSYVLKMQDLWFDNEDFCKLIPVKECLEQYAEDFVNVGMKKHGIFDVSIRNFEIYTKGALRGYGHGLLLDETKNQTHEFLFRFADPSNGERNTLVSVDCGCNIMNAEDVVSKFEECLKEFALGKEELLKSIGVYEEEMETVVAQGKLKLNDSLEKQIRMADQKIKCSDAPTEVKHEKSKQIDKEMEL